MCLPQELQQKHTLEVTQNTEQSHRILTETKRKKKFGNADKHTSLLQSNNREHLQIAKAI